MRDAWITVDLDAVAHNVAALRACVAPAGVCAVVKADGYGHGAVQVARAVIDAGASMLGVALVEEGAKLRGADLEAPILLLSEPPADEMGDVVAFGLTPTVYTDQGIAAAERAADTAGRSLGVHLKVDTGMHRVGAAPGDALRLARVVVDAPHLELDGLFTHFAVADEPQNPLTAEQQRRFEEVRAQLAAEGIEAGTVHAANSAGAITRPEAHYDLVRCGISVYGLDPAPEVGNPLGLRPALSLTARVSHVKRVAAGEALSYGQRYRLAVESQVATVPLGYAGRGAPVARRGGRRGADRWVSHADRGDGDDGPAPGRLRPGRRRAGRRRGRAAGIAGRGGGHGGGVGGAPGHDHLRGGVRLRSASSPLVSVELTGPDWYYVLRSYV